MNDDDQDMGIQDRRKSIRNNKIKFGNLFIQEAIYLMKKTSHPRPAPPLQQPLKIVIIKIDRLDSRFWNRSDNNNNNNRKGCVRVHYNVMSSMLT